MRKTRKMKRSAKAACGLILCVTCLFVCALFNVFASDVGKDSEEPENIYYTSVRIQSGDTLWEIAEETMPDDCVSVQAYVETLKKMNNLDTDDLQAGQYLIIAYTAEDSLL